ncbi:hypothetical protein DMX10_06445 [Pseudomonas sp. 57B-090624]|uniref:DUF2498 family protein n=1 Tax=Pseudomonas sp. 57B-090624 TaxID=2213080 RepID=UPI000DA9CED4|nr:DUF2498 family protein [Pseudomonas sp. 57B-090624]PZE14143.1 hypothetical protein DMX10_06445 [Pseudomonas sp. 57B-090624]
MKTITKEEMVALANQRLLSRQREMPGLRIDDAETMGSVLILRGECFLQRNCAATKKSIAAIRIYRELSEELSKEYRVAKPEPSSS